MVSTSEVVEPSGPDPFEGPPPETFWTSAPLLARAGLLTGVSVLTPLPFVDEWVAVQSRRHLISSLLKKHDRRFSVKDLEPLYAEPGMPWLTLPFRVARKLVLRPIRKAFRSLFFVLGARHLALEVGRTLLLGHTLERLLRCDAFPVFATAETHQAQARDVRVAFDEIYADVDKRVLREAASRALSNLGRGGRTIRRAIALLLVDPQNEGLRTDSLPPEERAALDDAADRVEEAFETVELARVFADFDRRFDAALARRSP